MVIEVLNLDKCIKKIRGYKNVDIMPPIKDGARLVQGVAKDVFCPVDTGYLRENIKVRHFPDLQSSIVYNAVEYAPHVEFGTSKMNAQPFMRPALQQTKETVTQLVITHVRKELANVR